MSTPTARPPLSLTGAAPSQSRTEEAAEKRIPVIKGFRFNPARFEPRNDNVLVQQVKEDLTTAGGLVLAEGAMKRPIGRIVKVGPGAAFEGTAIKRVNKIDLMPGDLVVFQKGQRFEDPDLGIFFICREDDIAGVLQRAEKAE